MAFEYIAESLTLEAGTAQANCPSGLRIILPSARDYNLEQFGAGKGDSIDR
jgi:hypothetical protein